MASGASTATTRTDRTGTTRRRRALVVVATALLLAACGATGTTADPAPPSTAASTPTAGATTGGTTGGATESGEPPTTTAEQRPLPPPFVPEPASWRDCQPEGYQCASVDVPLDYDHPDAGTITLALKRLPARDPARRIGSVLFNPGGPGASGLQALPTVSVDFSDDVRDRFDLVGFDPRGVGGSVPLTCDRGGLDFFSHDLGMADPPPEVDEAAKAWGQLCQKENGTLLPFVGTREVTLDLESLRQAVGDEKLTYAGYSYGTLIGLLYTDLFPSHIRAMVLDGIVDPTLDLEQSNVTQSIGVERALQRFFDWCPTDERCTLQPDAATALDELYRVSREQPLPGEVNDKTVYLSATLINFSVVAATYNSALWPQLAEAIAAGVNGEGQPLADLTAAYLGAASPSLFTAVNCLDTVTPTGDAFDQLVANTKAAAPRTGAYNANAARPCEFWPVPAKPLPTTYQGKGTPTILIFGTTGDNATPYENAVKVAGMLENARLVTLEADQHAALGANPCVARVQGQYLVDGIVPPPETRC